MGASPRHPPRLAACWAALAVAVILFSWLFARPAFGFWRQLAATTIVLAALAAPTLVRSLRAQPPPRAARVAADAGLGVASAALLYGVFALGKVVMVRLHPGSGEALRAVYALDRTVSGPGVALLLLLVIGPCEEVFWRGYLQRRLSEAYGGWGVALATAAYTAAHVSSGNPVLILAAAVCGTFWGLQYHVGRRLLLNVVSHALWTTTAFSLAPFA